MMILVDTTVWIDFFAARSLPHVVALETIIKRREDKLNRKLKSFPPIIMRTVLILFVFP